MAEEINYDDNLFFMMTRIKLLKDGLQLTLDAHYLKEYYINDIILIDKSLTLLQEKLTNNAQLVKLSEYMHSLSRTQQQLVEVITAIRFYNNSFTRLFEQQDALLENIADRQSNGALALMTRLKEGVETYKETDIISEEELSILMMTD